ncbi:hypothetical protein AVEN_268518-1 [Araneus ventricosus]|uniref:Uncharacterized protein n=1 Tax=Araneus ventricosus TaxID=182803 RepID=A0A4Y2CLZ3_ARAVE|nr:hypothetical protein AVEN_268518-1 [Araneus ventricosus]
MHKEEYEELVSNDEDIPVAATLTDLEICQAIKVDDSDGDECVEENPPTISEMRQALDILRHGDFLHFNSEPSIWDFQVRNAKALFQRRVTWTNFESLEVRTCGLWSVDCEQSRRTYGAWLCKYLGSVRVNGCNGAVCPLLFPLVRELFTATTRETTDALKLRSNGLSFHRFRPRFALFPVVGMGRIDATRGLVSTSVVSRVVVVNSSDIKGPDGAIASVHSNAAEIFPKPRAVRMAHLLEFHRPQSTSTNLERLEVWPGHTPLEQGFTSPRAASILLSPTTETKCKSQKTLKKSYPPVPNPLL